MWTDALKWEVDTGCKEMWAAVSLLREDNILGERVEETSWKFSRWALNEDRSGFWGPNHSCGKNVRLKIELLLVFPGATPLGKLIKPFCAYVVPRMKWELYLLICKHISYLHTFAELQFFQSVLFLLSFTTNIFLILEPESVVPL